MNKYFLAALACVLAILSGVLGYIMSREARPTFAEFEARASDRMIIWNKKDFERTPNSGASTFAVSLLAAMDAEDVRPLEGLNAYSFKAKEGADFQSLSTGDWVVQREYVHHVFMGSTPTPQCVQCSGQVSLVACGGASPPPNTPPNDPGSPVPSPTPPPAPIPTPAEPAKSWGVSRVHAIEAMTLVDTSKVRVGIVDTGLDLNHQCLPNVVATKSFTGEAVSPDPGQHGTHVAGTVAGKCGVGVSKAEIVFGKGLMNDGAGSSAQLAQAVNWVCSQNIQVASFSWGSSQSDPIINQAIAQCTAKGIAVVVANGNDGQARLNWPAALSQTNDLVFGIAASDQNDRKASFSSYGAGTKFIAPGVDIISNKPGGGTQKMSGSSMATPHVAGLMSFCVALKKPFQNCLKSLTGIAGYPLPDGLETVR